MCRWMPLRSRARRRAAAWIGVLAFSAAAVAGCARQVAAAESGEEEQLAKFLARLGLVELQVELLERQLRAAQSSPAQQASATRLADLYAQRLMACAEDSAAYADTLQRINRLLQDFPAANSTALQVLLLQADYNRAEALISAWIKDPQAEPARAEAEQILTRIAPLLAQHQDALAKQVEQLQNQLDALPEGDAWQAAEQELRRVHGIAARAAYFAGWSHYYRGLAAGAPTGADWYVTARDIFRRLLEFGDTIPEPSEAATLGLESIWRARAVIGLGLSESACGNRSACDRCFQLLEAASVPPEIADQAPYWYLRALLTSGQLAQAESFARQQIAQLSPPATQGRVSFCVALVREGFGAPGTDSAARRTLGQLGLTGLARLGQLGVIQALIDKYQITAQKGAGFVLLWAAGQQQFAAAEKSQAADDYQAAASSLRAALDAPEASSLPGAASRCRYTLAWCHYRRAEYEPAAREFAAAIDGLAAARDPWAAESAWMAYVAYRRLAESDARFVPAASDALERITQSFPDHPYAQRARFEMTRLLASRDPAAVVRELEAIPVGDEHYLRARYDLCRMRHRLWSQQRQDAAAGSARLAELRADVETLLRAAPRELDAAATLQCCLLLADAALHHVEPQVDVAAETLQQAATWVSQLPETAPGVIEYHYRTLELATAQENEAQRQQAAQWLTTHAAGSPYELPAMIIVATALDHQARESKVSAAAPPTAAEQQAYEAYARVVALLEQSSPPAESAEHKNLLVASSRLAHYAARRGQHAESARLLERVLAARPDDRQLLRRAGLARLAAGEPLEALDHWRKLVLGLPKGTDPWYEAKYYQVQALARTDREQARKVLRQFELLYPDLGGERWRDQFTALRGAAETEK